MEQKKYQNSEINYFIFNKILPNWLVLFYIIYRKAVYHRSHLKILILKDPKYIPA